VTVIFQPGELVPKSAAYQVHHLEHRPPHELNCVAGDTFPPCQTCGKEVRFIQLTPSDFMARQMLTEDVDFSPPLRSS
jgi:hypothetical protein